jgi:hypothetical protein
MYLRPFRLSSSSTGQERRSGSASGRERKRVSTPESTDGDGSSIPRRDGENEDVDIDRPLMPFAVVVHRRNALPFASVRRKIGAHGW